MFTYTNIHYLILTVSTELVDGAARCSVHQRRAGRAAAGSRYEDDLVAHMLSRYHEEAHLLSNLLYEVDRMTLTRHPPAVRPPYEHKTQK
jgi:hypothetical protein